MLQKPASVDRHHSYPPRSPLCPGTPWVQARRTVAPHTFVPPEKTSPDQIVAENATAFGGGFLTPKTKKPDRSLGLTLRAT